MVERHFPVILFAPPGVMLPGVKNLIERLSELLARRKMENEGVLREAASQAQNEKKEREYTATFLQRLRTFFEL